MELYIYMIEGFFADIALQIDQVLPVLVLNRNLTRTSVPLMLNRIHKYERCVR